MFNKINPFKNALAGISIATTIILLLSGCGKTTPITSDSPTLSSKNPISAFNFKNGTAYYYDVVTTQNVKANRMTFTITTGIATANVTDVIELNVREFTLATNSTDGSLKQIGADHKSYYVQKSDGLYDIEDGVVTINPMIKLPLAPGTSWSYRGAAYTVVGYENTTSNIGTTVYAAKISVESKKFSGVTSLDGYVYSAADIVSIKTDYSDRNNQILTTPF